MADSYLILVELENGPIQLTVLAKNLGTNLKDIMLSWPSVLQKIPSTHKLEVELASCMGCGFVFKEKHRIMPPSKCPKCRSEVIKPPKYLLRKI